MNFRKFSRTFHDDVSYNDESYLWAIEEKKNKVKKIFRFWNYKIKGTYYALVYKNKGPLIL